MYDGLFGFLKQVGSLLKLLRLLKSASYHNVLYRHLHLCLNGAGG